jgi:hypothetical protein
MALFTAQGMHPTPAPAGYRIRSKGHFSPESLFPDADGIKNTEIVIHEILGILSARIMGQIQGRSIRGKTCCRIFLPDRAVPPAGMADGQRK